MGQNQEIKFANRRSLRALSSVSVYPTIFAMVLLGGCSYVPDAANPIKWYSNTVDFFSSEVETPGKNEKQSILAKDRGKPPAASKKGFPKIRAVVQQKQFDDNRGVGLVADVKGRKYAPEIARQGEPSSILAAAPEKPQINVSSPAQTALPVTPVAQVVSAAPTTGTVSPEVAALSSTLDQSAFQVRMKNRLTEIRARAGQSASQTSALIARLSRTGAGVTTNVNPIETVVISSTGIETGKGGSMIVPILPVVSASLASGATTQGAIAKGAVRVATINFTSGSAKLNARDRQILAQVLRLQKERGGRLRVVGHASKRTRTMDPVRHKMTNLKVSTKRADVVARELARLGVKSVEMVVDAISDRQPVYYEFMPSGEAGNRRTEIYLES